MGVPSLICRGKNLHLAVMKQFLYALPKQDMSKDKFYEYAEERMSGFATTHSQIARQMGLYYCDADDVCHIRFNYEPTLIELLQYSKFWAEHYFVPNPYTPSFPASAEPTCIYGFIRSNCTSPNYDKVFDKLLEGMFNCALNEGDKTKAYLLQFTDMIDIGDGRIGFTSSDSSASVRANVGRNDIEGYFHYFDKWREAQKKPEDKDGELPPNVDRLSVALKLFAEKRKDDGPDGWFDVGQSVNAKIRGYFDVLTVDELKRFDKEKITELFLGKKDADGKVVFNPMWSGSNGSGWNNIELETESDVAEVVEALVKYKEEAGVSAVFCDKGFLHPKGFGLAVISELLMKFHPDSCFKSGDVTNTVMNWLGLIDFPHKSNFSAAEYKQICGAAAKILGKMVDMKLPRQINADGSEDTSKPDYLTVNEFIYFVNTNQDLIKEKVMSKQWKSVNSKDKVKNGTRKLSDALSGNDMLKRLVAALRTKPFAILAGHSGTGKSQLVRRLAYMTCNNELLIKEGEGKTAPGNYCMVQVKPNWHDSTDLLGYYSEMGERHFVNTPFVEFICKAYAYPDTPFFVCLDEMNLAPVEQYFAEYLSAIESMEKKGGVWLTDPLVEVDKTGEKDASGKEKVDVEIVDQIMKGAASKEAADWIQAHGLTIPKNLFVVGTVNMDETTCQFSRKVLDRAMTLLMNDVKFSDMAASKKPSDEELLDEAGLDFFLKGEERGTVGAAESALLDGINEPLANTPFVVAYRFANEYALYEAALAKLNGVDLAAANDEEKKKYAMEALDHVVMMKLLPRIHGERGTVRVLFEGGKRGDKNVPGLESKLPSGGLSVDMMKKILERRDEYLTFWP